MTSLLTTTQYGKKVKKSRQSILNAIKKEEKGRKKPHLLPGVISHKKVGRDYILEVSA